jgi:PilZ domain
MVLAKIIVDGNVGTYAQEAICFLVLVGGVLFLLSSVVIGQHSPSSSARQRKQSSRTGAAGVPSAARPWPARQEVSASAKDKRRALRRGGNRVAVLVSDGVVAGDPVGGLVLNRSRGGLCLLVRAKVDVDHLLAVRTASFPKSLPSVRLRVRHCKQVAEGWRLGCQFVDHPPWSTLLLFG